MKNNKFKIILLILVIILIIGVAVMYFLLNDKNKNSTTNNIQNNNHKLDIRQENAIKQAEKRGRETTQNLEKINSEVNFDETKIKPKELIQKIDKVNAIVSEEINGTK